MARIVLRPRASSRVSVPTNKVTLSDQRTDTTRPELTVTASRAIPGVSFTKTDLEDAGVMARKLTNLSESVVGELSALRALPFTRGVLLENVRLNGCMGQVDSISTSTVTMWRPRDALLFKTGDQVFAATTDGTSRGTLRNSGALATIATDGYVNSTGSTGTVLSGSSYAALVNWTTSIAALAVGDYLFLRPRYDGSTGEFATGVYYSFQTQLSHRLGVIPKWFWVLSTNTGTRIPEVTKVSADEERITLQSTRCAYADIFIAG